MLTSDAACFGFTRTDGATRYTGFEMRPPQDALAAGHRLAATEQTVGDGLATHGATPAVATPRGPSNHDDRHSAANDWNLA